MKTKICTITIIVILAGILSFSAHTVWADPWMGHLLIKDNQVWPEGRLGNYGTVKYFVDETQNDTLPIEVSVQVYGDGQPPNGIEVQAYSNLNRRDYAKIWESQENAGKKDSYYMTYPMHYVGMSGNNYVYTTSLTISKTGAYRLTTRFRINNGPWQWHNGFQFDGVAQRDCAIVVSPAKVRDLTLYEVNSLVVEAEGNSPATRSTLEDFTDHDRDDFNPFQLGYVKQTLEFNTLWMMPIFPITNQQWDTNQQQWVANFSPGSPYATRNYWAVNEMLTDSNDQSTALKEFEYLVDRAEKLGLNVFLDVAFNHAGRDVVYGQGAVDLQLIQPADRDKQIALAHPVWCSKAGQNYRQHAGSTSEMATYAPVDRLGEHSWYDAGVDWFFGDYASLGPKPGRGDTSQGGAEDERDLLYTDLDPAGGYDFEVENVWKYFAYVLPYWLKQTTNQLDGIRADFAQGLPPQAWEYIINKTRQQKWDIVFLAEALDPDAVRYRVNRYFDVLTTVDHWLYRSNDVTMSQLVNSLEAEAALYGYNALIMHNGTSHDEEGNSNVWLMTARYAVAASMYGTPMIYMTQPLGIAQKVDFKKTWQNLKSSWENAPTHVFTVYQRLNQARQENAALRSTNQYFLHKQFGGGFNENIFSVARWKDDNLVLVFVNLRDWMVGSEIYAIPDVLPLDTSDGVVYQAFNLVADSPETPLWTPPPFGDRYLPKWSLCKLQFPE